jgi:hypothetical protein
LASISVNPTSSQPSLDDDDVNETCEPVGKAMEAIEGAAEALANFEGKPKAERGASGNR